MQRKRGLVGTATEWPTIWVVAICYLTWFVGLIIWREIGWAAAIFLLIPTIALHSSLQHEIIHGHPTSIKWLNRGLVWLAVGIFVPFARYQETHLRHHASNLTDPHSDPESFYWTKNDWDRLPTLMQHLLRMNNTLLGRMFLGPLIGWVRLCRSDLSSILAGEGKMMMGYVEHILSLLVVTFIVAQFEISIWAYGLVAYAGGSVIAMRSYLEHCAVDGNSHKTAIVMDRGLLAFLFLNNNLHDLHHRFPACPWYQLSALLGSAEEEKNGYTYQSYWQILCKFSFSPKEPTIHPDDNIRDGK